MIGHVVERDEQRELVQHDDGSGNGQGCVFEDVDQFNVERFDETVQTQRSTWIEVGTRREGMLCEGRTITQGADVYLNALRIEIVQDEVEIALGVRVDGVIDQEQDVHEWLTFKRRRFKPPATITRNPLKWVEADPLRNELGQ